MQPLSGFELETASFLACPSIGFTMPQALCRGDLQPLIVQIHAGNDIRSAPGW